MLLLGLACGLGEPVADSVAGSVAGVTPPVSTPQQRAAGAADPGDPEPANEPGAAHEPGATDEPAAGAGTAPRAGDLLVLDADGGLLRPDGQRDGALFLCRRDGAGGYGQPEPWSQATSWVEPVSMEARADGSLLVVDMAWPSPLADGSSGAVFVVTPDGGVAAWWRDARLRMPVGVVEGPDGTVYVSDRAADPRGLGQPTGAVFAVAVDERGQAAGRARVAAAGPELVTPSALARLPDGRLLLMEADLNPTGATRPDGYPHTPGVLYELTAAGLVSLNTPPLTVSPVGLVVDPPRLLIIDANAGLSREILGDGAVWSLPLDDLGAPLRLRVDSAGLGRRALIDPAGGDLLADGRLVLADANADPLGLGPDGTGKGVYAVGHGAVLAVDVDAPAVEVLVASPRFVMPLDVWRVRW